MVTDGAHDQNPHDVLLGQFLDDEFALVDILGVGGFGTVYKAIQFPVRRPVAVKVLHSHYYRHEGVRQRFFQEARAIGSLTDSSIVKLIRFGEIEPGKPLPGCGGYFFMAQEFISGMTLREATRQVSRFEPARAQSIAIQILRALADAHRHGVVHRDLKPSNIMLTKDALGEESVRVLDFGVAKMLESVDDPNGNTPDTLTGVMLGTPNYMAPEQIHGEGISPATDLYAVGILLYEMLSGRRPFQRTSRAETLRAQLRDYAPPLTPEDGVPQHLTNVINTALHKKSEQRYQDAASFIKALKGEGAPITQEPLSLMPMAKGVTMTPEAAEHTIAAAAPVVGSVSDTEAEAAVAFQTSAEVNRPIPEPPTTVQGLAPTKQTNRSPIVVGVLIVCAGAIAWWLTQPRLQPDPQQPTTSKTATTEGANPAKEASEYQTSEGAGALKQTPPPPVEPVKPKTLRPIASPAPQGIDSKSLPNDNQPGAVQPLDKTAPKQAQKQRPEQTHRRAVEEKKQRRMKAPPRRTRPRRPKRVNTRAAVAPSKKKLPNKKPPEKAPAKAEKKPQPGVIPEL